jgi:ferredoxin/flavodoxin---NADP+ reductase
MTKALKNIRGDQYLFANRVIGTEEIAPKKYALKFEKQFNFRAGQIVAIAIDQTHEHRIYSICSGENDNAMQIIFDLKEDGFLTPHLSSLRPGDQFFVSKPYGSFLPSEEIPMWWIATERDSQLKNYYMVAGRNRSSILNENSGRHLKITIFVAIQEMIRMVIFSEE